MTFSRGRGHAPGYHRASNVVDLPQEAALIRDLRRLQRCVEHEGSAGRERFPHAIEVRPPNSRPDNRGGIGSKTPEKAAPGAVGRLLGTLGLYRRNSATRPGTLDKPAAFAKESAHLNMQAPSHTRPVQKAPRIHSERLEGAAHHSSGEPWRVLRTIVSEQPRQQGPEAGYAPNFVAALKSARAFERLRAVCAFLVSRAARC